MLPYNHYAVILKFSSYLYKPDCIVKKINKTQGTSAGLVFTYKPAPTGGDMEDHLLWDLYGLHICRFKSFIFGGWVFDCILSALLCPREFFYVLESLLDCLGKNKLYQTIIQYLSQLVGLRRGSPLPTYLSINLNLEFRAGENWWAFFSVNCFLISQHHHF